MAGTVTDAETGKKRVVHMPTPKIANVLSTNTVSEEPVEASKESRQVRRSNARRAEKRIRKHMNEVVLKKNRARG